MGDAKTWMGIAGGLRRAGDYQAAHEALELARRSALCHGDAALAGEIAGEMTEVRLESRARGIEIE